MKMTSKQAHSADGGLSVAPSEDWRYLGSPISDRASRLWSLSAEVRHDFCENIVESWGSTSVDTASLDQVMQEFRRSCATLPGWDEALATTWQDGPVAYGAVSGTAVVADEGIESSSIIALRTSTEELLAHQVVVTTFADNHDRHLNALGCVKTDAMTLECLFDACS